MAVPVASRRNFIKKTGLETSEKSFQKELQQAKLSGTLNLSNRELETISSSLLGCSSSSRQPSGLSQAFDSDSPRWWENVDIRKLYIHCNKLSEFPAELVPCLANGLVLLDVHENLLTNVSLLIGDLQFLQSLNLSHNRLSCLPDTLVNLHNLYELNIAHNILSSLPEKWNSLSSLTVLDLSHNKLIALPDSFGYCLCLTSLILSNNRLQKLPENFSHLRKLEALDLSFNYLSHCDFSTCDNLKTLKIDHNALVSLPNISSRHLKELSACDNSIVAFPISGLESFHSISILNLRGNKLSEMSKEVAIALQQIERLDLANNDLTTVPAELGLVESLKTLCLDGNPLKALRRDVVSRGTVFVKQWLVSRLPESVLSAQSDQKEENALDCQINYSKSQKSKPEEKTSGRLDLSQRGSENLTVLLCQANSSIKELILRKNRLQSLDGLVIDSFRSVSHLDFSCNQLQSLPEALSLLSGLCQLNISNNKFFGHLPTVIYGFKDLEVLLAADNAFDSLDADSLVTLKQLSVLDIRNNNFPMLEPRIATCNSLKHLEVTGNPFKMPRPEIVRKGSLAILEYLKTKIA